MTRMFAVTVLVAVDTTNDADTAALQQLVADDVHQSMCEYLLEECVNFASNNLHYEFTDIAPTVHELVVPDELKDTNK